MRGLPKDIQWYELAHKLIFLILFMLHIEFKSTFVTNKTKRFWRPTKGFTKLYEVNNWKDWKKVLTKIVIKNVIWKTSKYLFENQGKNKLELCVSENVCQTTFILIHRFKYQCEKLYTVRTCYITERFKVNVHHTPCIIAWCH